MGLPRLTIALAGIRQNVRILNQLCRERGIFIAGVTKGVSGSVRIAGDYLAAGLTVLADARVQNLQKFSGLKAEKWLIRLPLPSEAEQVVQCADISLNSEWDTICALDRAAQKAGRRHGVILMSDLGDLREGETDPEKVLRLASRAARLRGVELRGVGTNLTCLSFIHPDEAKMAQLQDLAQRLPMNRAPIVSAGNSASLDLLLTAGFPAGVNNLRLGESLLLGRERSHYQYLPGTRHDTFILAAELVELKIKPSVPWGETGTDSYGRIPPRPADRGLRLRGIVAVGRQDCDIETMWPEDPGIEILGASSDYVVLDLTRSARSYQVGEVVRFELGYFAIMRAMTSPYVTVRYEGD
ncbi:alanine/ornithine racemase family PLP-dependent enzyme [Oscillospiraceae bacterium HV4-5-C5C]|nr:alanine/ornithine racemase family PLP-dependent enzyme [Oscillospiraceae bacterium HV4-5-C5C]